MAFDEVYETLPGNGWLSKEEARLLWEVVSAADGPILEIGCHQGRSTVLLAASGRLVHAVDPFAGFANDDPDGRKTCRKFVANLESRGICNVVLHQQRAEDFEPARCGFAYLDGDHTYEGTKAQIVKAQQCGAKIIAVHDANDSGGGLEVKRAALDMLGPWSKRVERLAVWGL